MLSAMFVLPGRWTAPTQLLMVHRDRLFSATHFYKLMLNLYNIIFMLKQESDERPTLHRNSSQQPNTTTSMMVVMKQFSVHKINPQITAYPSHIQLNLGF
jgi:hypothetical protein